MARPNYAFAKRQKELARKQKKEDKLKRKAEGRHDGPEGSVAPDQTVGEDVASHQEGSGAGAASQIDAEGDVVQPGIG